MNPNGIKKNDIILVIRDNGNTILGTATKVAPWAKNPKITVVNYHFKEGEAMYASKADARRCSIAPAHMIPKPPEAAPISPIMAKWSIGKTKRGPMMMEGYYFSAPVLLNGKRVGEVIDEGNGGSVMTRFKDHALDRAFNADCKEWALASGASGSYLEAACEFWGWYDDERTKGITAEAYFKAKNDEMAAWLATVKPVHTGDLSLVEGKA
jgi:hypothetical protein